MLFYILQVKDIQQQSVSAVEEFLSLQQINSHDPLVDLMPSSGTSDNQNGT